MAEYPQNGNYTRDLNELLKNQTDRMSNQTHSIRKMKVWYATVRVSTILKRFFDITISLAGLVLLMPLFVLVAVLIKLTSPGPIFFVQYRVGRYGRHFRFFKFRSMYVDAEKRKKALLASNQSGDGVIFKMKNDPRITPIGKILRKTSFDEMPQLVNVLCGDMSLVGPRPPLPSEVAQYTLEDRKRLNVKPGLTCLWQIQGRSDIPFKKQVKLDLEYIQSSTLRQDLLILLKTIPAIISGRGAY